MHVLFEMSVPRALKPLIVLLSATALLGCGSKGPLYMPGTKPPPRSSTRPAPVAVPPSGPVVPTPDPERPVPAESSPAPK